MAFIQYFFFMYGLHSLLGNCIKSLQALKYSFLQYPEVRIFTQLGPKILPFNSIIQHLTHFGPTPDMEWLIIYPKKRILESFQWEKFSNILILDY